MAQQFSILVVDDEQELVHVICDRLATEGCRTVEAYDGVRAIEAAHRHRPDLILLDVRMPAGTGQTVLHSLRAHADTHNIPVLVMTALPNPTLEEEMLAGGAQDFVRKPFDMAELVVRIRRLLKPWDVG